MSKMMKIPNHFYHAAEIMKKTLIFLEQDIGKYTHLQSMYGLLDDILMYTQINKKIKCYNNIWQNMQICMSTMKKDLEMLMHHCFGKNRENLEYKKPNINSTPREILLHLEYCVISLEAHLHELSLGRPQRIIQKRTFYPLN